MIFWRCPNSNLITLLKSVDLCVTPSKLPLPQNCLSLTVTLVGNVGLAALELALYALARYKRHTRLCRCLISPQFTSKTGRLRVPQALFRSKNTTLSSKPTKANYEGRPLGSLRFGNLVLSYLVPKNTSILRESHQRHLRTTKRVSCQIPARVGTISAS
jgi:hypothetical protein